MFNKFYLHPLFFDLSCVVQNVEIFTARTGVCNRYHQKSHLLSLTWIKVISEPQNLLYFYNKDNTVCKILYITEIIWVIIYEGFWIDEIVELQKQYLIW